MKNRSLNPRTGTRTGFARLGVVWLILCTAVGASLLYRGLSAAARGRQPQVDAAATASGAAVVRASLPTTAAKTKNIEDVRAGDKVWAYDPAAGTWAARRVIAPLSHEFEGELVTVTVAGRTVESTWNHPFWVQGGQDLDRRPYAEHVPVEEQTRPTAGRWVDAKHFQAGDVLVLRHGGPAPVEMVTVRRAAQRVYNLKVEDLHTYAVGDLGVATHNKPCFPPGTRVRMADGTSKPIEDVAVGDRVLAADPLAAGPPEPREVTGLIRDFAAAVVHVTMATPGGGSCELTPTRYHPCWTANRGWVDAQDLAAGDVLRDERGRPLPVTAARVEAGVVRSYNLSVAGLHTFFALADDGTPILVHNAPIPVPDELFHYTNAPDSSFAHGLHPGTYVTDNGGLSAWEAMQKLGIPQPNKVIPVQNGGSFVPDGEVPASNAYRPYYPPGSTNPIGIPTTGGEKQFYNPKAAPPSQLGPAKPLS